MKYIDTRIVFREVPDELTLAINISGCPVKCPGCHSPYLTRDIGEVLDEESLRSLVAANPGITCVAFMGGDADPAYVSILACIVRDMGLKACWYSGRDLDHAKNVIPSLDFIKVGPYIEELGPLDFETSNQRFYHIKHTAGGAELADWTEKFRKKIF